MKHPNKSLVLASLQIKPYAYEPGSELANNFPAPELFDKRHDFLLSYTQSALAVLMTFHNERHFYSDASHGIRRAVTVALIDATAKCVLSTATVRVNISKDHYIDRHRVDFPFAYADIDPDHTYKVLVRDESTKAVLDETCFNMFDPKQCGRNPAKWYKVERGGISPDDECQLYRSIEAKDFSYHRVRYFLKPQFKHRPLMLPEVEIRLYCPDGLVQTRYFVPEIGDTVTKEYFVAMSFLVLPESQGIYYTELLCMGHRIAGFVFSTQGPWAYNSWESDELTCLKAYSLTAAAKRFQSYFAPEKKPSDSEDDLLTDEDYDRLLNKFIASEIGMDDTEIDAVLDILKEIAEESDPTEENQSEDDIDSTPY